jgi:predicted TIM-barrel fold metal-dependent hydrolase
VDGVIGRMGLDHVMVESDYPHADSTWPSTHDAVAANFGHLPDHLVRQVTSGNAAALFGVDLPPQVAAEASSGRL